MARKSKVRNIDVKPVRRLDYRYSVEVTSLDGRVKSTILGTTSLNTWTNKRDNGVTVRVDHAATHRFPNSRITARSA
jgi:hypothetical protein